MNVPFDTAASKNVMWQPIGNGRMIQRKESSAFANSFADALRLTIPPSVEIVQDTLWLDIFVEKSSHRSDALNVLDVIADSVEEVTGLNDRWYSIAKLDWCVKKDDPQIWVTIGQDVNAQNSKICGRCGRKLPMSNEFFTRNKSREDGLSSRCKRCDREARESKQTS